MCSSNYNIHALHLKLGAQDENQTDLDTSQVITACDWLVWIFGLHFCLSGTLDVKLVSQITFLILDPVKGRGRHWSLIVTIIEIWSSPGNIFTSCGIHKFYGNHWKTCTLSISLVKYSVQHSLSFYSVFTMEMTPCYILVLTSPRTCNWFQILSNLFSVHKFTAITDKQFNAFMFITCRHFYQILGFKFSTMNSSVKGTLKSFTSIFHFFHLFVLIYLSVELSHKHNKYDEENYQYSKYFYH